MTRHATLQEQFTQTDPLQADIGAPYPSSYVYGNNNPAVFVDPSGERAAKAFKKGCGWLNGGPIGEAMPSAFALIAPLQPGPKPKPGPFGPLPPIPDDLFPTTTKPPAPKPPAPMPKPPVPSPVTTKAPGGGSVTSTTIGKVRCVCRCPILQRFPEPQNPNPGVCKSAGFIPEFETFAKNKSGCQAACVARGNELYSDRNCKLKHCRLVSAG